MQNIQDDLLKRLIIADASFLTVQEKLILQKNIDTSTNLALLYIEDICNIIKRPLRSVSWDGKKYLEKAKVALKLIQTLGIKWTAADLPDYPVMFKEIADSPYMIFYRGDLKVLENKCVSVVGTRRASVSAKKAALQFAMDAADDGCTVVSGLAFGIDVFAHKGALKASKGATVAILPGGIDIIYPASHTKIAAQILEQGGLLLSEYTPGTPAQVFRFVQRDRLIAALSSVTVVVQAPAGSGALITAQFALENGRDVIFHSACFDKDAEMLKAVRIKELEAASLEKDVSSKFANTAERYLEDGAPVIDSYADYVKLQNENPGTVFCRKTDSQPELFN